MNIYDEQEAVAFIKSHISDDLAARCDDDTILEIIDIIFDYYEDHDLLELDVDDDDSDDDIDAIIVHAIKIVGKDKHLSLSPDDVAEIVKAEIDYELSLDD